MAGKAVLDNGIASRFRPRRYYTIPREALERSLEDVEQLLNFFCIECQRILFAENVPYTLAVSNVFAVPYSSSVLKSSLGKCSSSPFLGSNQDRSVLGALLYRNMRPLLGSTHIRKEPRGH